MFYLAAICITVMLAATGCSESEVTFSKEMLVGTWQKNGTQAFVRFMSNQEDAMDGEYNFGYEWDEGEDVHPEDLKYHGNGWFKWQIIEKKNLREIELMDNGETKIPKTYTIQTLTDKTLIYIDDFKVSQTFTKVK